VSTSFDGRLVPSSEPIELRRSGPHTLVATRRASRSAARHVVVVQWGRPARAEVLAALSRRGDALTPCCGLNGEACDGPHSDVTTVIWPDASAVGPICGAPATLEPDEEPHSSANPLVAAAAAIGRVRASDPSLGTLVLVEGPVPDATLRSFALGALGVADSIERCVGEECQPWRAVSPEVSP